MAPIRVARVGFSIVLLAPAAAASLLATVIADATVAVTIPDELTLAEEVAPSWQS